MANTIQGANAYLQIFSDVIKKDYVPGVYHQVRRFSPTTQMMQLSKRRLNGNVMEYEFQAYPTRNTHATFDAMEPRGSTNTAGYGRFTLTFDHTDESLNDFIRWSTTIKTTLFDILKDKDSNIKEPGGLVARALKESIEDIEETRGRYLHLPSDGLLATIATSGVKAADSDRFTSASAYSNGVTSKYCKFDAVSVARLPVGQLVDVYTTGGVLRVSKCRIEWTHPDETASVLALTADSVNSGGATVTNMDSVAATDKLYHSGAYNVSPKGTFGRFFDTSQTYYGKTRVGATAGVYRMLCPINVDASAGSTAVALTPDHIRRAGFASGWSNGNLNMETPRVVVSDYGQWLAMSKFGKDQGMIVTPALESQVGQKLNLAFGFNGYVMHDPNFGSIALSIDNHAAAGEMKFLNMADWECATPFPGAEFQMMDGTAGMGYFSQHTEDDGSGKPSMIYSAFGMMFEATVCTRPTGQTRLHGLATTGS